MVVLVYIISNLPLWSPTWIYSHQKTKTTTSRHWVGRSSKKKLLGNGHYSLGPRRGPVHWNSLDFSFHSLLYMRKKKYEKKKIQILGCSLHTYRWREEGRQILKGQCSLPSNSFFYSFLMRRKFQTKFEIVQARVGIKKIETQF